MAHHFLGSNTIAIEKDIGEYFWPFRSIVFRASVIHNFRRYSQLDKAKDCFFVESLRDDRRSMLIWGPTERVNHRVPFLYVWFWRTISLFSFCLQGCGAEEERGTLWRAPPPFLFARKQRSACAVCSTLEKTRFGWNLDALLLPLFEGFHKFK